MNLRDSGRVLLLVALVGGVSMGGVLAANVLRDIPSSRLTGDPAALAGGPFYLGTVTMLRTALLAGAAAVCLVTARVVRGRVGQLGEFLGVFGLFSTALVLDDQFQGHEAVLDRILGVPQPLTFAAFAAVVVALAVRYGRLVLSLPAGGALLCAFPLFAIAVVADAFDGPLLTSFTEASAESLGIFCLAFFGLRISSSTLQAAMRTPAPTAEVRSVGSPASA